MSLVGIQKDMTNAVTNALQQMTSHIAGLASSMADFQEVISHRSTAVMEMTAEKIETHHDEAVQATNNVATVAAQEISAIKGELKAELQEVSEKMQALSVEKVTVEKIQMLCTTLCIMPYVIKH